MSSAVSVVLNSSRTMDTPLSHRNKILALHQPTTKAVREIASDLNMPHSTVARMGQTLEETGTVEAKRKGRCGRKPNLTTRTERQIIGEVQKEPAISVAEIMRRNPDVTENE